MHRLILVLAGLAAVTLTAAALAAAHSSATLASHFALKVRMPGKFGQVDQKPKGDSLGDYFTNSGTVYRGTRRVGTIDLICFTTWARKRVLCNEMLTLADGEIESAGAESATSNTNTDPIVGSTGAYANARGTVTYVDRSNGIDITVDLARK